ncbi:MAG: DegQ family serine endoprotease [bacterium]
MNNPRKFQIAFLLIAGMLIGALATSHFNLLPQSQAKLSEPFANEAPTYAESPAETPPAMTRYNNALIADLNDAFITIAEKVQPSVVTVFTNKVIRQTQTRREPFSEFWGDDFFRRFFGPNAPRGEQRLRGQGSGVIVSAEGYIITNNHVVRDADEIDVMFYNGNRVDAEIIGTDPKSDIAVIKVNTKGLRPMTFGDSERLRVGEWVMAIGSPLSEDLASTVTAGIVSAKGRSNVRLTDYENFIQTDAAINPGNSGGALVNLNGELVGINTAIVSQSGGFQGIGFAVPIKMTREVMELLIRDGRVVRSWIGVNIQEVDQKLAKSLDLPSTKGALVVNVVEDSPAEKAGIAVEDVIVGLNDMVVRNVSHLRNTISLMRPGTEVDLKIIREGKPKTLTAKLVELPEDDQQISSRSRSRENDSNLGFYVETLDSRIARRYNIETDEEGVVVVDIDRSSSAFDEGLREGDLIMAINRQRIATRSDFRRVTGDLKSGDMVMAYVQRRNARIFIAFEVD